MNDDRTAVELAEDELYSSLDRYGATKRTTYLISALIDAKVAAALASPSQPYVHPAFPYENPRTPAETEAMLNHMADVHLTPTAEKGK